MIVNQSTRDHRHDPHEMSRDVIRRKLSRSESFGHIHTYIYTLQLSSSQICEVVAKFIYDMRLYVVDVYL